MTEKILCVDDITTIHGTLVCARGQEVTRAMRFRLRNFSANIGIRSPIRVFVPLEMADQLAEQDSVTIGE